MKRTVRLGLSAVMGLSAALLAWSAVAGAHAEAEQASRRALERYGGDVTRVCVALREIEPGDEISEGNVKVVEWVSSLMPEDALTSMGDASGLVATARIPAHTPLAKAHFLRDERPCRCRAAQWRFRWQVTRNTPWAARSLVGTRSTSMLQTLRLRIA